MRIPQALVDEIVAHSHQDAPNECCGLIGGRDGEATSVHRAENLFASPLRFEVKNPVPLLRAIEDAGEDLAGIYHSHTRSEAYPSQTDVNLAGWPDAVYVIVSLADPGAPDVKGFRIRDGEISDAELDVA